jgi:hypothetical protein
MQPWKNLLFIIINSYHLYRTMGVIGIFSYVYIMYFDHIHPLPSLILLLPPTDTILFSSAPSIFFPLDYTQEKKTCGISLSESGLFC